MPVQSRIHGAEILPEVPSSDHIVMPYVPYTYEVSRLHKNLRASIEGLTLYIRHLLRLHKSGKPSEPLNRHKRIKAGDCDLL